MRIRYSGNKFDEKQLYSAIKCIVQNWWALGDKGLQFQHKFCKVINRKYGVFVNSGSSANLLAIYYAKKLGYRKAITPVCGFPTTINAIIQFDLQPIFIDIDKNNLNLKISELQQIAKNNPNSVLIFAHALGNPPDMNEVMKIVKLYNLYLIEDCCDALGSECIFQLQNNKMIYKKLGTFGQLATYSFYPAHHISTGEGGFIATDDYKVYKTLMSLRDWGRDCICHGKQDAMKQNGKCGRRFDKWLPGLPDLDWDHKYCYSQIGFNFKPLELQAVIGLQQIKKLPEFISIRKYNFNEIYNTLKQYENWLYLPQQQLSSKINWFCFPITIKQNAPFKRMQLINYLEQNGIETRLYFGGNILYHQAYKDFVKEKFGGNYNKIHERFPDARYVTQHTLFIGVSQIITKQQIKYVCQKLKDFMDTK